MRNRELTGRFVAEKTVFGEGENRTIIGEIRVGKDTHTIKLRCGEDDLQRGMMYRFFGHERETKYGLQFHANSFSPEAPADDESFAAYLKQCSGPTKGSITDRVAWLLVETFGDKCVDVVVNRPAEAAAGLVGKGTRWDEEKALAASEYLRQFERVRGTKIQLLGLLDGRGFPNKTVDRAIRALGASAATQIEADPYILTQFPGIGFLGADKMYCDLAKKNSANDEDYRQRLAWIKRQALCAAYAVRSDRSGSVWVARRVAELGVRKSISNTLARPDEAIQWAIAQGILVARKHGGDWLAITKLAEHELEIAKSINDLLMRDDVAWPADFSDIGNEHQASALATATSRRVGVLRGSPGTGKTYSVAFLIRKLIELYGENAVAIGCPTGKAAVRATQAMVSSGVSVTATTIHRMLVVEKSEDGGWSFYYGAANPLPFRFIIADESSMLDCTIMASLLRACSEDCHVLFVGDAEQLAPVGPGRPFLDIQNLVPTGSLTEIRRNSGRIVRACAEIRDTRRFTPSKEYDEAAGENLPWIECKEADLQETVMGLVQQIENGGDCNPIWDVQLLTACNQGSPVSRKVLNPLIQQLLNPQGRRIAGNPFRVGDKIVCLKNGGYWLTADFLKALQKHPSEVVGYANDRLYRMPDGQTLLVSGENSEVYVANGELAEVLSIDPGKMVVRLFDPSREVTVPYQPTRDGEQQADDESEGESKGAVGDWDLGYVLTGHKGQGSQWQYVVWVCDPSGRAKQVQTRNLVYTNISRATKATFCIGEIAVANAACQRDGIAGRKTFLVERSRLDRAEKNGLIQQLREAV